MSALLSIRRIDEQVKIKNNSDECFVGRSIALPIHLSYCVSFCCYTDTRRSSRHRSGLSTRPTRHGHGLRNIKGKRSTYIHNVHSRKVHSSEFAYVARNCSHIPFCMSLSSYLPLLGQLYNFNITFKVSIL